MIIGREELTRDVILPNDRLKRVKNFKYLGSYMAFDSI